jgi:hypothetical protein
MHLAFLILMLHLKKLHQNLRIPMTRKMPIRSLVLSVVRLPVIGIPLEMKYLMKVWS